MNKKLPPARRFSGIEQANILLQMGKNRSENHRLQHELNALQIAYDSIHQELIEERKKNEQMHDEVIQHLCDKINLGNEVKKLHKALEFYADHTNYKHIPLFKTANILIDKGDMASYVLGGNRDD